MIQIADCIWSRTKIQLYCERKLGSQGDPDIQFIKKQYACEKRHSTNEIIVRNSGSSEAEDPEDN
jgi:hypothetical protein